MLRKIKLANKPLSLEVEGDTIYFGDSRGDIFKLEYPFLRKEKVYTLGSPIACLIWYNDRMFFANWDGEIGFTDFKIHKTIELLRDIVKCMTIFKEHLFVSIDHMIYVLDLDLKLLERLEPPHKVLAFYPSKEKCLIGMGVPFLGEIIQKGTDSFRIENINRTEHDTSILSIYEDLTGSMDGNILKKGQIIYSSTGWITSIFSESLFSSGRKIIQKDSINYKEVYSHEDDVMRVMKIKDKIVSIGLDYTLCIWEEDMATEEELKEIEELNRMF